MYEFYCKTFVLNGQLSCKSCFIQSGQSSGLVEGSHIVFAVGSVYILATLLWDDAKIHFKWLGGSQSKHCYCFSKYSMCLWSLAFQTVSQSSCCPHLRSPPHTTPASRERPPSPWNLKPKCFFPVHTPLLQLSLPSFICSACCLDRLSGCIRLSKQRCSAVPACYKYLWCPLPHSSLSPLFVPPPPSEVISSPFFLILSLFFAETQEGTRRGTEQQQVKKKKCHDGESTARWPHRCQSRQGAFRGHHGLHVFCTARNV